MRYLKLFESSRSNLDDFADFTARGTKDKNNKIYTNMYNYYSKTNKDSRSQMVGWLATDSQELNFSYVVDEIEEGDSVLDFGCGLGDFYPYIKTRVSDFSYLGVDINPSFINDAKRSHRGASFQLIDKPTDVKGQFDVVTVIGVFTWFITKRDFEKTLKHLYSICKRKIIVTCLYAGRVPHSWTNNYRGYDLSHFREALPEAKINGQLEGSTVIIHIEK
jgi:ubiquinone/menaquinone biosynthesis C-methylase UbiE